MDYTKEDIIRKKDELMDSLLTSEHQVAGLIEKLSSNSEKELAQLDLSSLAKAKASIQDAIQQLETFADAGSDKKE